MTHRNGAACSADVLGRWRELAEQRLKYLSELFESGRWRRYYGETAFLENIREAKVAVEIWRRLSTPRAMVEPAIRVTWPSAATAPGSHAVEPAPAVAAEPITAPLAVAASTGPMIDLLALERALDEPAKQALDLAAIEKRYPLLRNTL